MARGCGEEDILLALVSGGGSALLSSPVAGITLEEKREVCVGFRVGDKGDVTTVCMCSVVGGEGGVTAVCGGGVVRMVSLLECGGGL